MNYKEINTVYPQLVEIISLGKKLQTDNFVLRQMK